ncbi:MAG: transposase, partial [Rhodocyclaceae bacterium]|nr:transposase [Rhodocyclaceae bacterium]
MNSTGSARILTADEAAALAPAQVVELSRELVTTNEQLAAMQEQLAGLQHQLDWFKRQVFGQKSEKRIVSGDDAQMSLGELFATLPEAEEAPSSEVA